MEEVTNEKIIADYLKENGYESVEEWALDSGYVYNKMKDVWYDDDGYAVTIEDCLYYALEAGWLAAHEN